MADPIALLLVPRTVDSFILYDQGQDLLRSPGVIGVDAPRPPYGVLGRLPDVIGGRVAEAVAQRMRFPGDPVVLAMFHPFQWPLIDALTRRFPRAELWYGLWDRFDRAPDAGARDRRRLETLHARAASRADLVFAVSTTLVDVERAAGRDALLMPSAADSFPAPDPEAAIVAVSFGTLGRRTDWKTLRAVAERLPELIVLMVGRLDEDQCADDPDYAVVRGMPNFVWLGRRSNDEAARLVMCADVGLLPFRVHEFNEAGLPNRILKAARVGRKTITPDFSGVEVWAESVVRCADVDEWVAALRDHAGARTQPDVRLREWALAQTGEHQNRELWRRLGELGVAAP